MSEWIKCSERLPDVVRRLDDKCTLEGRLIAALNTSREVITFNGISVLGRRMEWFDGKQPLGGVTHWMPLPDPPK